MSFVLLYAGGRGGWALQLESELCLPEVMRCVLLCWEALESGFRNFHYGRFLVTVRHLAEEREVSIGEKQDTSFMVLKDLINSQSC
jgi:hypothetical protein